MGGDDVGDLVGVVVGDEHAVAVARQLDELAAHDRLHRAAARAGHRRIAVLVEQQRLRLEGVAAEFHGSALPRPAEA